ncbi:MAG: hypothetical protein ABIQ88_08490 [Chitinophagaceae bacterium]
MLSRCCGCIIVCCSLLLVACHQRSKSISFYYWRTSFKLDSLEKETIQYNAVETLFTRYFDIDFLPADTSPKAIAPIVFATSNAITSILPVVYIKNRVFERLDTAGVTRLTERTLTLVNGINRRANTSPKEIQFDCDWTETTRDKYFLFLRGYKRIAHQPVSATIRLHQVKYPGRTGIPPVDYGVLMYYNMGSIDAGTGNSIYEKSTASKYNPSIKNYPLTLDIALPIFAWGLQVRDGKVIKLLNKMNFLHFENDTNFIKTDNDRFTVQHACFHGGYYFQENDVVKTEYTPEEDLLEIVKQVNRYSNGRIRNLIFYDLDKENLVLYEKNIFKEIMDSTD